MSFITSPPFTGLTLLNSATLASVSQFDITDLDDYFANCSELQIDFTIYTGGVNFNTTLRTSEDNGSSYKTSNYAGNNLGTSEFVASLDKYCSSGTATEWPLNYQTSTWCLQSRLIIGKYGTQVNGTTRNIVHYTEHHQACTQGWTYWRGGSGAGSTEKMNAIRITNSVNITSGFINIYGKQL